LPAKGLRGAYDRSQEVARLKSVSDIEAALHESGHHIESVMADVVGEARRNPELWRELESKGRELYPDMEGEGLIREGWAKVFADTIREGRPVPDAPLASGFLGRYAAENAEFGQKLTSLKDLVNEYAGQTETQKMVGATEWGTGRKLPKIKEIPNMLKR
jgi:hypothetical protein